MMDFKLDPTTHQRLSAAIEAQHEFVLAETKKLRDAQNELEQARLLAAGISNGSVVYKGGQKYRVCGISIYGYTEKFSVSLYGNPTKKNGEFAETSRYLGTEWSLCPDVVQGAA
jgi:hypothetical protein